MFPACNMTEKESLGEVYKPFLPSGPFFISSYSCKNVVEEDGSLSVQLKTEAGSVSVVDSPLYSVGVDGNGCSTPGIPYEASSTR